ncbi:DPP6 N-terminal domain-like protein [Tripterygium wilfordii]|uniref:DPP6 N-terminal domain-like protein n=1 Tax=Tripterygium wilfordii TaxID=458696 RepID=A0A7J7DRY9_TRIWF|nr:uncharacterized protein LOC119997272 [Tripterygium wilfordii]KAF5749053.1 DPP6 N-terminal domain-like protein [Tripterygium wilfordii]
MKLKFKCITSLFLPHLLLILLCAAADHEPSSWSSIVYTTVGRADYAFDVFSLPTEGPPTTTNELQITDGQSVNFNGHFPNSPSFSSFVSNQTRTRLSSERPLLELVYVTERNGLWNIYYDAVYHDAPGSRSAHEIPSRVQVPLLGAVNVQKSKIGISMKDKPSVAGDYLIYVSNHDDPGVPRTSWAAVYSAELSTGFTRRLTPFGIADFSPAVSPSGTWTAVASYGERGWSGEVEELSTDIYVFLTRDGTRRIKVVEHGGWPSWVDDSTLYFHRRSAEDKWISVYRAILPTQGPVTTDSVIVERVTPPGVHAFTPATAPGNKNFIAVATRRPTSKFRHIELYDLSKKEFRELTRLVSPTTNHFNPFISPDSILIGYHKCRGGSIGSKSPLFLENIRSPDAELSLFRFDGNFPSFSPKSDRVAYNGDNFMGVYVANRDGSNLRKIYPESAFMVAWDWIREGVVYTSTGPFLARESTEVDIISINVDDGSYKRLTTNAENNAFPSPSPDGKWVVFRSGRSGHKNLYIMDAVNGESASLSRLTEGPWADTMCSWSPNGDLIVFASDRDNPGSGSFGLYLIHPNGTGLKKLLQSGSGGQTTHPSFSPDGKTIVFTSDYGGISAEPISNPNHFRPDGEIFTIKVDGSDLKRLTYDSYDDGTPTWIPFYIKPVDVEPPNENGPVCDFEDCLWLNQMPNPATSAAAHMVSNNAQARCGA